MLSGGFYLNFQFDICMIYKGLCEVNKNSHFLNLKFKLMGMFYKKDRGTGL